MNRSLHSATARAAIVAVGMLLMTSLVPAAPAKAAGPLVVIDPGHGGPYPGATNCNHSFAGKPCMQESDLNLDIALRAERMLRDRGFRVRMTRTADTAVNNPPRDIRTWNDPEDDGTHEYFADGNVTLRDDLQARVNVANCGGPHSECSPGHAAQAQAFVSIHNNACGCAHGTETYHFPGSSSGRHLATLVHEEVVNRIKRNNRGVKEANFYVIRWTRMSAALLEGAFVDNPDEARLLLQDGFRQLIAEGVVAGLVRYFGFDAIGVTVPPLGRKTVSLNKVGIAGDVSTVVTGDRDVVAERAVYFTTGSTGGTGAAGSAAPSTTWHFAEGATHSGMATFVLLQNPGSQGADVQVRFLTGSGGGKTINVPVGAGRRRTVSVNRELPGQDVSTTVTSNVPIVAERAVYSPGPSGDGHVSPGATQLSTSWNFAEGYTGPGFTTFLLLGNPGSTPAVVTYRLLRDAGAPEVRTVEVPGGSRRTIPLNRVAPASAFGIAVSSSTPIIAERSVYRTSPKGATNVVGSPSTSTTWYFAEGYTGPGHDTWLLLANPSDSSADVEVLLTVPGRPATPHDVVVPGGARRALSLTALAGGSDVSARVSSRNGVGVVAERAMYFATPKVTGAHASLGLSAAGRNWHFAEGYTGPGFSTFVLLWNPHNTEAHVVLKLM